MIRRHLPAARIGLVVLAAAILGGCATDSGGTEDPLKKVSRAERLNAQEEQRRRTCASIADQLQTVDPSRRDAVMPYPSPRNQEGNPGNLFAEYERLKSMERRYHCDR